MTKTLFKSKMVERFTNRITLSCHPAALHAWKCWNSLPLQISPSKLSNNQVSSAQKAEPLWILAPDKQKPNNYEFFSGFAFARAIQSGQIERARYMICSSIDDSDIKELSESYIERQMVEMLHKDFGIAGCINAINDNFDPKSIKNFLVNTLYQSQ